MNIKIVLLLFFCKISKGFPIFVKVNLKKQVMVLNGVTGRIIHFYKTLEQSILPAVITHCCDNTGKINGNSIILL